MTAALDAARRIGARLAAMPLDEIDGTTFVDASWILARDGSEPIEAVDPWSSLARTVHALAAGDAEGIRAELVHARGLDEVRRSWLFAQMELVLGRSHPVALVEAMPPEGWGALDGSVLAAGIARRDHATAAAVLERLGFRPPVTDARALLAAGEAMLAALDAGRRWLRLEEDFFGMPLEAYSLRAIRTELSLRLRSRIDPAEAALELAHALGRFTPERLSEAITAIAGRLTGIDSELGVQFVLEVEDPFDRVPRLEGLLWHGRVATGTSAILDEMAAQVAKRMEAGSPEGPNLLQKLLFFAARTGDEARFDALYRRFGAPAWALSRSAGPALFRLGLDAAARASEWASRLVEVGASPPPLHPGWEAAAVPGGIYGAGGAERDHWDLLLIQSHLDASAPHWFPWGLGLP